MRTIIIMLTISMIGMTASAQNPFKNRTKQNPAARTKTNIDLETEPSAAPSEKLTVDEFMLKRKDFIGQVVELEFDRAAGIKQVDNGYTARLSFEDVRDVSGLSVLFPEEGFDLFEPYVDNDARYRRRNTVMVEVLPSGVVRAVGERYSKNKPEGERYIW